ncbi:MAG TPA: hypothetical protein VFO39_11020 [Candidatus Sulfotelmatobacter sp.]|nr:hypothetical protein [Candidatus Sulfotelmatobacter sp.]
MSRLLVGAMMAVVCAVGAVAQTLDDLNLQIHGFATQAFLYSNANNYLGMNTSSGSLAWTEAALNVNDQVSDKLRVGAQFHYTRLGTFGGDALSLDWAEGDYKVNSWLGVRAGKLKIRWGLYNNTQDYDPGYLWSLLPEPIYGVDIRATNLSQLGVEFYGRVPIQSRLGKLDFSAYYGDYVFASNDGYAENFKEQGINFVQPASGKTPGFDLCWTTPLSGLKLGGSLMMYDATGNLTNGTYRQPLAYWPTYYAQYDYKKLFLSGQYVKLVQYQTVSTTGEAPVTSVSDARSWFVMAGYHLTSKLQAGAYYTSSLAASADESLPINHFYDWVASSRYDLNANFYLKLEGHFIDGNQAGFYTLNNPSGFKPRTNLLVAKIGFTF